MMYHHRYQAPVLQQMLKETSVDNVENENDQEDSDEEEPHLIKANVIEDNN